jgi:hypothetical protein
LAAFGCEAEAAGARGPARGWGPAPRRKVTARATVRENRSLPGLFLQGRVP